MRPSPRVVVQPRFRHRLIKLLLIYLRYRHLPHIKGLAVALSLQQRQVRGSLQ
jgi:hypothetical protein